MSGLIQAFQEFRPTSKIDNCIFECCQKIDQIKLSRYCLEKDINIVKEKKRLLNFVRKHGLSWGGTWENNPELEEIISVGPNYASTYTFTF